MNHIEVVEDQGELVKKATKNEFSNAWQKLLKFALHLLYQGLLVYHVSATTLTMHGPINKYRKRPGEKEFARGHNQFSCAPNKSIKLYCSLCLQPDPEKPDFNMCVVAVASNKLVLTEPVMEGGRKQMYCQMTVDYLFCHNMSCSMHKLNRPISLINGVSGSSAYYKGEFKFDTIFENIFDPVSEENEGTQRSESSSTWHANNELLQYCEW